MTLWTILISIIIWPGRMALKLFPNLGPEESRLLEHMTNYIIWLVLICGPLIYVIIKSQLPQ